MSQAHERIIANVPRVTKGNKGNGAIYKFWLVYIGNFQPISFVILLLSIKYAPSHTNSRAGLSKSIQSRRSECAASAPLLFLVQHGLTCSYKSKQCRECGKKTKKKPNPKQNNTHISLHFSVSFSPLETYEGCSVPWHNGVLHIRMNPDWNGPV